MLRNPEQVLSVDERCAMLADMALGHAANRQFRTLREDLALLASFADRIIALRTQQAVQEAQVWVYDPLSCTCTDERYCAYCAEVDAHNQQAAALA